MSKGELSRRQFLKLAALAGLSPLASLFSHGQQDQPNVLLVVFDAWSAENVPLYGYPRNTMPYLAKLADRAVVYHNHYAAGPWTIPGTGSLLTGTYPWTHRAFTAAENKTLPEFEQQNIFSQFKQGGYFTTAFSHNIFADQFFYQFKQWVDKHVHRNSLFFRQPFPLRYLFPKDPDASGVAEMRMYGKDPYHSSIFFEQIINAIAGGMKERLDTSYAQLFPDGLPATPVPRMNFLLEDSIDHLMASCASIANPYLSYYHFYPPHQPYHTRAEFDDAFKDDGIDFPEKPLTIINEDQNPRKTLRERQAYDEFLLYVDAEFHRMYTGLERAGLLDNTWLVLTSDHGELFERGNIGHETLTGLDPAIHIPLLIFPPGQKERVDVFETTSAVDVLPTLLNIAGLPAAEWTEGLALPPFSSGTLPAERAIFCYHPNHNPARQLMREGAATIIKEGFKFFSIFGDERLGENDPYYELYDLAADPEELHNLVASRPALAEALNRELQRVMAEADKPFRS